MVTPTATDPGPNVGPDFDGEVYDSDLDRERLTGQLLQVYDLMKDGQWRTLLEIREATGITLDASISKQLRHLRYERFGSYLVEKRRRGEPGNGVWEYRVGGRGEHTHSAKRVTYNPALNVLISRPGHSLDRLRDLGFRLSETARRQRLAANSEYDRYYSRELGADATAMQLGAELIEEVIVALEASADA